MSTDTQAYLQRLIGSGRPVGEVMAVNSFLIRVQGLQPVSVHSLVIFEDGTKGFVQHILEDHVVVLHLGVSRLRVGMVAVVQDDDLTAKVGKDFIGRVISASGEPLDGKGVIAADANWPIFNAAPPMHERELLNTQLETGLTIIDGLFPVVRGQRMALLGDSKSGKSTLATQIAINQRNTDQITVYVLIAKRRSDIDTLLARLVDNKALDKTIVVVSTIFESLVMSYLVPYVGCAIAEYLWQHDGMDVVVVYDDLTSHAQAYREMSLLAGVSPGRDSYPGDIFYIHSSLLERAGRLKKNQKCLTAIPLVLTDTGDITSFLPTNVMSITDGQWILDVEVSRSGLRPAINTGLSVSRVGGRGHNKRQKDQNARSLQVLTSFARAQEFAHFGSELAVEVQRDVSFGRQLHYLLSQLPGETYGLLAQQMMLDVVLDPNIGNQANVSILKDQANNASSLVKSEKDYGPILDDLKRHSTSPEPKQ